MVPIFNFLKRYIKMKIIDNLKNKDIVFWLTRGWFLACVVVMAIFMKNNLWHLYTDDMSAEMILGHDIAAGHHLFFSGDWHYATELRVINSQLVYALLFRLFSNWATVRYLGLLILYAAVVVPMYFLFKAFADVDIFYVVAGALAIPFTHFYYDIVLVGNFYSTNIMFVFLILTLMITLTNPKGCEIKKVWLFVLYAILLGCSFITGIGGVRHLLILFVPSLIGGMIAFLFYVKNGDRVNHKSPKDNLYFRFLVLDLICTVVFFVGYEINSNLLSWMYGSRVYDFMKFQRIDIDRIVYAFQSYFEYFGFVEDTDIFSFTGVCGAISVVMVAFCILAFVSLIKNRDRLKYSENIYVLFALFSQVVFILVFAFTDSPYVPWYNEPFAIFLIPVLGIYVKHMVQPKYIKWLAGLLMCGCFVVLGANQYQELENRFPAEIDEKVEIVDFLLSENYLNGYSTFTHSTQTIEMSNNRIDVWQIEDSAQTIGDIYKWLELEYHEKTTPDGKVFFLVEKSQKDTVVPYSYLTDNNCIYETDSFWVYGFESYDAIPMEMKP